MYTGHLLDDGPLLVDLDAALITWILVKPATVVTASMFTTLTRTEGESLGAEGTVVLKSNLEALKLFKTFFTALFANVWWRGCELHKQGEYVL